MMDGMEEVLHSETNGTKSGRSDTVDLNDSTLQVDISDALSEREKVKFTVHTKTTLPDYNKSEFSVVRQHEEFIWLHDRFDENEDYAGYIIPPPPPRPDFDASREKLQKLGEGEGSMTKEEFNKMKQELEASILTMNNRDPLYCTSYLKN
ncbi:sorting nexin-6-like isoform X2 [Penaeus chinensis]|uniref:sorting nexin-6-like isoform X2 n=1 Tax=Penaeus chinensis TaxID=139456 RepID=UPI001FB60195|nr:sorting nexin-6-like isoform X2 [Penaeus chinensis]